MKFFTRELTFWDFHQAIITEVAAKYAPASFLAAHR